MTKIPKEPMPSTNRDDRQRDSVPSPFTFVNEPFDSDSDTETEDSGNWPGESLDAALDAALESVSKAASNWIKKARGSVSMKRVMKMMRDRYPIKFIAVMGLTGAGKSSAIRNLTGKDVFIEHGINSGTTSFAMFPAIIESQYYIFIDTPGFNDSDSGRSDPAVFLEILSWFREMSPFCNLAGILYVHDITTSRFSGAAKTNIDLLQALCGEEYFRNVTILTTMWRKLSSDSQEEAEVTQDDLEEGPWKAMRECGARVFQHLEGVVEPRVKVTDQRKIERLEKQRKKAKSELEEIIAYYKTSDNVAPEIQQELRAKVDMFETKAGQVLKKIWFPTSEPPPPPPPPKGWLESFVTVVKRYWSGLGQGSDSSSSDSSSSDS